MEAVGGDPRLGYYFFFTILFLRKNTMLQKVDMNYFLWQGGSLHTRYVVPNDLEVSVSLMVLYNWLSFSNLK